MKTTIKPASMRKSWTVLCAVLFAVAFGLPSSVFGQTVNVNVQTNRDTTVTPFAPNSNTGGLNTIYLNNGRFGLVGFDNIPTTPAGQEVVSVELHLCGFTASGEISIYEAEFSWNESTATWNMHSGDLPSGSSSPLVQASLATGWNTYTSTGLTNLVKGWADGTIANNGFAITSTATNPTGTIASREYTGGSQPEAAYLKIGYAPVPEPSSTALLGLAGLALILRHRK